MSCTTDEPPLRLVGADRVLAVLKELGGHPDGATLDDLVRAIDSAKPTVHRALASLRRAGLARQDWSGRYHLGDEFLRLAFAYQEARPAHVRIRPTLERLADRFGEAAHFAVLDGMSVVYQAKVEPAAGAVRLSSMVGGRNPAHSTGVGKALLAYHFTTLNDLERWMDGKQLERRTSKTKVDLLDVHDELELTRERGFAVDDEENETGVNCVALPVPAADRDGVGAISVSALTYRTPLPALVAQVDEIRSIILG